MDKAVRDATTQLDMWDEPNFAIIRAVLERHAPDQSAFVFDNLEPAQGREAVLSVATLLDRLQALKDSPERKSTRKADHAALAVLASRGYTEEELSRLKKLVEIAQTVAKPAAEPVQSTERQKILRELYAWYKEWSTVAKQVMTRRDDLIRLGLAKRRTKKKPVETPVKPPEPTPPVAPEEPPPVS